MATRRQDELISSEKVARATGRAREEWFELLDAAGAAAWNHARIAAWLSAEHDVDGWWAQGVTVGYEQARGMRQPGQRPDGTFDASASKTVAGSAEDVFSHVVDDALRAAWLEGWRTASATPPRRARLEGAGGARVLVELTVVSETKVRVAVQHVWLPDPAAVVANKAVWRAALARLADRLATTSPS